MVFENRLRLQYGVRLSLILLTAGIGWTGLERTHSLAIPLFMAILLGVQVVSLLRNMEKPLREYQPVFPGHRIFRFFLDFFNPFPGPCIQGVASIL